MQLSTQAVQWERATAFSYSFDFRSAYSVYEAKPHLGRTIRAVSLSKHRWVTFFLRDAVGQVRTPGRLFGALAATVIAGSLITLSLLPGLPSALLAGIAGVVIYHATGPLTKGLQHAASVAGDYPLYGISDRHLVLLHTLLPSTVLFVFLSVSATIASLVSGVHPAVALPGVSAAGVLALALRTSSALKEPLSPSLLMPINTPLGNLSAIMRLGWAFSELLLATLGTLAIALLLTTPIPLTILMSVAVILTLVRWQKRR